jgi:hypothetical protein
MTSKPKSSVFEFEFDNIFIESERWSLGYQTSIFKITSNDRTHKILYKEERAANGRLITTTDYSESSPVQIITRFNDNGSRTETHLNPSTPDTYMWTSYNKEGISDDFKCIFHGQDITSKDTSILELFIKTKSEIMSQNNNHTLQAPINKPH